MSISAILNLYVDRSHFFGAQSGKMATLRRCRVAIMQITTRDNGQQVSFMNNSPTVALKYANSTQPRDG